MITKKGTRSINLPECVDASTVRVYALSHGTRRTNPEAYTVCVQPIFLFDLMTLREKDQEAGGFFGMPVYFAVGQCGDLPTIELYPASDAKREMIIRYCPAMKEI